MNDLQKLQNKVIGLKGKLPRGGQREIARRIKSHPNQVAMAFDGFVNNQKYLQAVLSQAELIIQDKNP